jgi:hypothetical protein
MTTLIARAGDVIEDAQLEFLEIIEGILRLRTVLAPGISLPKFLKQQSDCSEIVVCGHSKGGALAIALGTWLATQWDHEATVDAVSIAGPTPGNAAFAELAAASLGSGSRSFANPRDPVPHAWQTGNKRWSVSQAAECLDPDSVVLPLLVPIVEGAVAAHVYRHPPGFVERVDPLDAAAGPVPQHVCAYADAIGLTPIHEVEWLWGLDGRLIC